MPYLDQSIQCKNGFTSRVDSVCSYYGAYKCYSVNTNAQASYNVMKGGDSRGISLSMSFISDWLSSDYKEGDNVFQIGCLSAMMMISYVVILFILFGWWWTFHAPQEAESEPLMTSSQSQTTLYDETDGNQQSRVSFRHIWLSGHWPFY